MQQAPSTLAVKGMHEPDIAPGRRLTQAQAPSKHARGRLPKKSRRERHADKIERRERIRAALDVKAMQ